MAISAPVSSNEDFGALVEELLEEESDDSSSVWSSDSGDEFVIDEDLVTRDRYNN